MKDRLHDDSIAELFAQDPAFATAYFNDVITGDDLTDLMVALRQIAQARGPGEIAAKRQDFAGLDDFVTPRVHRQGGLGIGAFQHFLPRKIHKPLQWVATLRIDHAADLVTSGSTYCAAQYSTHEGTDQATQHVMSLPPYQQHIHTRHSHIWHTHDSDDQFFLLRIARVQVSTITQWQPPDGFSLDFLEFLQEVGMSDVVWVHEERSPLN